MKKESKYNQFIGKTVGCYKVLKNIGKINPKWPIHYFLCECLDCGETKEIDGNSLVRRKLKHHQDCKELKEIIKCLICGKEKEILKSSAHEGKYCSLLCYGKSQEKNEHGSVTMYIKGCRCVDCKKANAKQHLKYSRTEKGKAYQKEWIKNNPKKVALHQKKYRLKNKEKRKTI